MKLIDWFIDWGRARQQATMGIIAALCVGLPVFIADRVWGYESKATVIAAVGGVLLAGIVVFLLHRMIKKKLEQ